MRNQWTKSVAAATFLIAAGGMLWFFGRSATPSYALEQTLNANRAVRTVHVQNISPPAPEPQDMWIEYDDGGEVHRLRVEEGEGKTFRIMVWANGELRWFSPVEGKFIVLHEPGVEEEMLRAREAWDPHLALESIHRLQQQGKVRIRTQEPKQDSEPITLEVTELEAPESPPLERHAVRYVLSIDPQTKLLTQRDMHELVDGTYQLRERRRYRQYNVPIDPGRFVLEPPQDVELDDRTEGIGMAQERMTDAEAAAAVLRLYFETLIAQDYQTAGGLYNGKPAAELKQRLEEQLKVRYLRVVSIGKPEPLPGSGPRVYQVPFAVEIEHNRVKEIWGPPVDAGPGPKSQRAARIRPVEGKGDRWIIQGGV
jgi:hypothetical protein